MPFSHIKSKEIDFNTPCVFERTILHPNSYIYRWTTKLCPSPFKERRKKFLIPSLAPINHSLHCVFIWKVRLDKELFQLQTATLFLETLKFHQVSQSCIAQMVSANCPGSLGPTSCRRGAPANFFMGQRLNRRTKHKLLKPLGTKASSNWR